MKKTLIINVLLLINSVFGCTNKFNGRPVTAAGDFNSIAQWLIGRKKIKNTFNNIFLKKKECC